MEVWVYKEQRAKKKLSFVSQSSKMPPAEVIPCQTWFAAAEEEMEVEEEEEEEEEMLPDGYWSEQFILSLFLNPHLEDDGMVAILVEEPGGCYGYSLQPQVIYLTEEE